MTAESGAEKDLRIPFIGLKGLRDFETCDMVLRVPEDHSDEKTHRPIHLERCCSSH